MRTGDWTGLWGDVSPWEGVEPVAGKIEGFHKGCPLLADLAKRGRILEIGTHHGASAIWMAENGAKVLTIDAWALPAWAFQNKGNRRMWTRAFDRFRSNVLARHLEMRISYLPMLASEARKVLGDMRFDGAYVDGDHEYEPTRHDIEMALGVTDGPVVVDDCVEAFPGVVRAVSAYPHTIIGRKAIIGGWHGKD